MSLSEELLNIDTPENVAFNYEVAGVATRGLAAVVDSAIIVGLQILVGMLILGIVGIALEDVMDFETNPAMMWTFALLGLVSFALLWGYYVFFELLWNGQSPGKRWLKLRVVLTNGMPITLTEVLIRNLVRLVDFLPVAYGVGIIVLFVHPQTRRLGDLAAGTLVVRDRAAVTLGSVVATAQNSPHSQLSPAAEMLALERLTAQDIRMITAYLERYDTMQQSYDTGMNILRALLTRMGAEETWMDHLSVRARLRLILEGVQGMDR
ncbi:MAG TPA: RDD family protein [Anaerolineae bacterium]|nr:RDD family protein [Anaerolineae bacterium]